MGIIIRQSIKGTAINYVGVFIGFLTNMLIATYFLSQEVLGLISVLLNAALLLCSFAQLGISYSAMRFFPYFKDKEGENTNNNGFFYYLASIPLLGLLLFGILFLLLKAPITAYFAQNSSLFVDYYYWIIPFTCFLLYGIVFETYSNLLMRIVIPKFIKEIVARLLMVVIYLLYALGFLNLDEFIAGYIGIYAIIMIATFYYVSHIGSVSLKHDSSFIDKPLRKSFMSYTTIILIGSLGGTLVSKLDLFMVTSGIGLASAAVYTIAANMATVIEIPSRSIIAISSPLASEALQAGDFAKANNLYKKVSLHQLVTGSIIFLLVWININNIYKIIPNGELYQEGKWVVLFIGIAKLIEVTLNFGGNLISYSRYYHWGMYFVFFISGLTICLNNFLIPLLGITGAAVATFLTCLISYGAQQLLIFIKIKGNPYSVGTLKQIVLILLLIGLNSLLPVVDNPWIDAIYRTSVISTLTVFSVYFLNISEEINHLVRTLIFSRLKKR